MEHVSCDIREQFAAASRHMKMHLNKDEVEPPLPYDLEITFDTFDLAASPGCSYLLDCGGLLRIVKAEEKIPYLDLPLDGKEVRTLGRVISKEWHFA